MPRVGTVPYLNALPLLEGLAEQPGVRLVSAVPSQLVDRLRGGELDAALVSSVELFRAPPLDWIDGLAITSSGPVHSILLFCNTEPERVRQLALDRSSRSAAVMAQVCLARFLGAELQGTHLADPQQPLDRVSADAVLRIGDPALRTDPGGRRVLDLGAVWTEATGLPFVYALWLARPDSELGQLPGQLRAAARRGLARRDELARRFAARHAMDSQACVDYLAHAIGYILGDAEREGLCLFGRLAQEQRLVDHGRLPAARCHAPA